MFVFFQFFQAFLISSAGSLQFLLLKSQKIFTVGNILYLSADHPLGDHFASCENIVSWSQTSSLPPPPPPPSASIFICIYPIFICIYPMVSAMTSYSSWTSRRIFVSRQHSTESDFRVSSMTKVFMKSCLSIVCKTMFTIGESQAIFHENRTANTRTPNCQSS